MSQVMSCHVFSQLGCGEAGSAVGEGRRTGFADCQWSIPVLDGYMYRGYRLP